MMTQIETSSSNRLNNIAGISDALSTVNSSIDPHAFNLKKNGQELFISNYKQNKVNDNYFDDVSDQKLIKLVHGSNEVDVDFKCESALNYKQKNGETDSAAVSTNNTNKSTMLSQENSNLNDIKVQVYYCGIIMVVYIKENLRLEELYNLLRQICKFDEQQLFTVKWVDEEGDPCTLSSQLELDESLRLYYLNKESELVLHIFANIPERPGTQCAGEDRSIYRRGARRWRKIYLVNGHKYQAKRFARTALCKVCQDRIWGLGRQGYKCLDCKIMVHKRCHKFISLQCAEILLQQQQHQQQQLNSFLSTSSNMSNKPVDATSQNDFDSKQVQKHKQAIRLQHQSNQIHSLSPFSTHQTSTNKTSSPLIETKNPNKKSFTKQLNPFKNGNNISVSTITTTTTTSQSQIQSPSNKEELHANELEVSEIKDSSNMELRDSIKSNDKICQSKQISSHQSERNGSSSKQIGLDQFNLIKVIGRGSYAKVFLVEYKKSRKCYAMKVIKKSIVDDDEDIDWVQTEKHVFEQATNHPFLVGLHSCFQTESRLFFVIEYLCGGDLMYHMQRKRRLPEDHARFYSAEISIALGFLHSKGIIYRDLKLDNVLLDIEGHIKLTDYGMCKEGLSKTERTSTFCGTPNYIAPEMLRGEDYDFSVDWWALGVLLYEMMAGRSPFEPINENPGDNPDLNTEDHLFQVILEKPIRIPRSLSVKAASVLKGFLQKTPSERLASHDGLNEIKQHLFFRPIDWDLLEQRLIQPPYKPPVQSERDLANIDEIFTREAVVLTPDTPNTLARIQQNEFEGFEYINPLILSDEIPV